MAKIALIVDDSASMRMLLSATLKSVGFRVIEGSNGQEALDCLKGVPGGKVDLIVTDMNMPVMDGLTFIRQARSCLALKFTPILMLTTESRESGKAEGKAAGATGWIVKPFHPEQLLRVIERVLPV